MSFFDVVADFAPIATIIGGAVSGFANANAAGAQADAINNAAGITQGQFEQIRADNEPFRLAGLSALDRLLAENIGPLEETPDFRFIRDQGQQAINRSLSARGKRLSGQGVKEGVEFATGLAGQQAGNRRQTLASIAGFGPGAAGSNATAGLATGGRLAQLALGAGDARASSFAAPANAFSSTIEDLIAQAALSGAFN